MEELSYALFDGRKFYSLDEALKEVERVRAFARRKRLKTGNESAILVGISDIDAATSIGKYGYCDSKRNHGKKVFIGKFKSSVPLHLHWLVTGPGSSAMCSYLGKNFKKTFLRIPYPKKKLETHADLIEWKKYIEEQSRILRHL